MKTDYKTIKKFIDFHYRHFNAATVVEAAKAWVDQLKQGNKMMLTLAGAMSSAELGITIAELIRKEKIHAIVCTGANLEEDVFNLVAHDHYCRIPNWRSLSTQEEQDLYEKGYHRVTDTCIPEEEALRHIEKGLLKYWKSADKKGQRYFPHEFLYQLLLSGDIEKSYQIDPQHSWLLAAARANLPIFVPGWEDSTCGNIFVANVIKGNIKNIGTVRSGLEYMQVLVDWYQETTADNGCGFFQIGGGIAGDFPICVVPLLTQDLRKKVKRWSYFCQISDSTTSYGSYSGAVPNEKITWGKLEAVSPKFIIESDATIVAPLVFSYVLAGD